MTSFTRRRLEEPGSLTAWFNHKEENTQAPNSILEYLKKDDSKVKARRSLNPFLVTGHSKLFVINKSTAFLARINIGDESHHKWHDINQNEHEKGLPPKRLLQLRPHHRGNDRRSALGKHSSKITPSKRPRLRQNYPS